MRKRSVDVPLFQQGMPPVAVRPRKFRIQLQSPLEAGNCPVEVLLLSQRVPEVQVAGAAIRPNCQRCLVTTDLFLRVFSYIPQLEMQPKVLGMVEYRQTQESRGIAVARCQAARQQQQDSWRLSCHIGL